MAKDSGMMRTTLTMFKNKENVGIGYEYGCRLNKVLEKWEMENIYGKEKIEQSFDVEVFS